MPQIISPFTRIPFPNLCIYVKPNMCSKIVTFIIFRIVATCIITIIRIPGNFKKPCFPIRIELEAFDELIIFPPACTPTASSPKYYPLTLCNIIIYTFTYILAITIIPRYTPPTTYRIIYIRRIILMRRSIA